MGGKGKMIKQKGFANRLVLITKSLDNEHLNQLTNDDIDALITIFFKELAMVVRGGKRVVFEGWVSFFAKPVMRICYDQSTNRRWPTYKKRIRSKFLPLMREHAEVEITESEYQEWKLDEEKK